MADTDKPKLGSSAGVGAAAAGVESISLPTRLRNLVPPIIAMSIILLFWENFNWMFDQPDWLVPPISKIFVTAWVEAADRYIPTVGSRYRRLLLALPWASEPDFS